MSQAQQPQALALVMAQDMRTHAPSFGNHADELERQHYEIADLKEQLTAARIAQPMPPLPWDRPSVESLLERLVTSHISAFLAGERGSNNPEVRDFVKSALVDAAGLIRAVLMDIDALEATKAAAQKHPDDAAVDRFADAMKAKLAQARAKGRSGWEGCDPGELSRMLREHVEKGDPRDVANFCMFLWSLGQPIAQQAVAQGQDAPQWVATLWKEESGALDFEVLPPCTLPEGEHKLYVLPHSANK